ncbi:MAG: alpha-galactosidase [Bacteroidaceae bacterium]|nr:alpha-galactosidase [Bacteroidaceae bacterium]
MNKRFYLIIWLCCLPLLMMAATRQIKIDTNTLSLVFQVGDNGRFYQSYLGKRLHSQTDLSQLALGTEAYITHGMEDYFEPAIHVVHNDFNSSLLLKYQSHEVKQASDGASETIVTLQDDKYPVTVKLHYVAYVNEDIIKTFTEISHQEKKPVELQKFASSMLHFNNAHYYLTEFSGDWAEEVRPAIQPLFFGKKVIDTKLGSRADMFVSPFFQLALGQEATETNGEVLLGTLGWTGNFQFIFEVNQLNGLRVISGINPYSSAYTLNPNEVFRTPDFYFTYSFNGTGEASRNFHRWARKYQIKDGDKTRFTLLNNWENTSFNFNEEKLVSLMGEAKDFGLDIFLLDDGWFGTKYPRNDDRQGLGDWTEIKDKLPHGVGYLTEAAKQKGVKFGIWIEPEMVNPKSELYEKHPDWVIHLPNRDEYYFRNQLVLDLSNPQVQDYVYGVVDGLMTKYPEIAFFKWDCNSPITNIYSYYLKEKQTHLYIDYVRGLYNVLERVKAKYPNLPMMLCSGGGARTDYEALKYFTEFWASDNTDPIERLYIQWGYSQVFPSKVICAHVTSWNRNTSIKFRTDVAMMGKLGFDINLSGLNADEATFCKQAVKNYNALKPVILDGDMYRLVSPYEGNHTSTMYVSENQNKAVVFAFDIHPRYSEAVWPVKLQGLNPNKQYRVQEINRMPNARGGQYAEPKTYSGEYLMQVGLNLFSAYGTNSRVIEVTAE